MSDMSQISLGQPYDHACANEPLRFQRQQDEQQRKAADAEQDQDSGGHGAAFIAAIA